MSSEVSMVCCWLMAELRFKLVLWVPSTGGFPNSWLLHLGCWFHCVIRVQKLATTPWGLLLRSTVWPVRGGHCTFGACWGEAPRLAGAGGTPVGPGQMSSVKGGRGEKTGKFPQSDKSLPSKSCIPPLTFIDISLAILEAFEYLFFSQQSGLAVNLWAPGFSKLGLQSDHGLWTCVDSDGVCFLLSRLSFLISLFFPHGQAVGQFSSFSGVLVARSLSVTSPWFWLAPVRAGEGSMGSLSMSGDLVVLASYGGRWCIILCSSGSISSGEIIKKKLGCTTWFLTRCTMWWFNIYIQCEIMTTIKLTDTSITSQSYHCVCVFFWWEYLRAALLAMFKCTK